MTELYFQRHRRLRQNAAMRALVKKHTYKKKTLFIRCLLLKVKMLKTL